MCQWTVRCVVPQAAERENPVFSTQFQDHLTGKVKWGGKTHSGLHSLYNQRQGKNYQLDGDRNFDQVNAGFGCPNVYYATATLVLREDRRGEAQSTKYEKASTFFPDSMCPDHIQEAVIAAWKDYKFTQSNANVPLHRAAAGLAARYSQPTGAVRWAGRVNLTLGRNTYLIWIGGCGTGINKRNVIETAFPARWVGGTYGFH